jgi:beta-lactamase class A
MTIASIAAEFESAAARDLAALRLDASVHAVDLASGAEVGRAPDRPVVAASVFKIPVLLELCRQASDGRLALTDRLRLPAADRTLGGVGLSVMLDDAELSVRDVAYLMMAVSDNHATDVQIDLVGRDAINRGLEGLGLDVTRLTSDCRGLFESIAADIGEDVDDDALSRPDAALRARLLRAAAFDPARTSATTARETTSLLNEIWADTAAPPDACAEVRRVLGLQVWPHRLAAGFPDSRVKISGKTGTVTYVRNEAGVVEYPDGGRYAVGVFVRDPAEELRNPDADRVIGTLARRAVDALRGEMS